MIISKTELNGLINELIKCFSGEDRLFPLWFINTMQHNFLVLTSAARSDEPAAADLINIEDVAFFEYEQVKNLNFTFKEAKIINYFIKEEK